MNRSRSDRTVLVMLGGSVLAGMLNQDVVVEGREIETDGFILEKQLGEEGEVLTEQLRHVSF